MHPLAQVPHRALSRLRSSRAFARALAGLSTLLLGSATMGGACRGGTQTAPPAQGGKQEEKAPPKAGETQAAPVAAPAAARAGGGLSLEEAHRLLPRADLSGLTPEQMAQLHEIAGDTFDYAGCDSTLAACLRADIKDKHAPRMALLASMLIRDGLTSSNVVDLLERYYGSFAQSRRVKLRTDDCPALGPAKAPVNVVEFSDYQCPHCAAAVKPLHQMVEKARPEVRLCSKYFPLAQHPRAAIAAACAEYARGKGRFWEMNDLLFSHQEALEDGSLKEYAQQLGLDGDDMLKKAYAGAFDALIEQHKSEGTVAGLRATPTFYFNGRTFLLPAKLAYLVFSAQDELEWVRGGGAWEKE